MKNKSIFCIMVLLLLVITVIYNKPIQVKDLIRPYTSEVLPKKINSFIFFSSYSQKELNVTGEESMKEIVMLLGDMKVRRKLSFPNPYRPKIKNTYQLIFLDENNKYQSINILNSKYIEINHKPYKIIGTPNLSSIYASIILDQPIGEIDEFYYNLMHQ